MWCAMIGSTSIQVFTPGHLMVLRDRRAEPSVQRIFVNAAIKKALCREAKATAAGLRRSGRVGMIITFTSEWHARPAAANAGPAIASGGEAAARAISPIGFRIHLSIEAAGKSRPKPSQGMTMAALPAAVQTGT